MKIKKINQVFILLFAVITLISCSPHNVVKVNKPAKTLVALGYGTADIYKTYSAEQRRLISMRASKMDAYRNLAEQIHGIQIHGRTTVSDMIVEDDNYKLYVDAFLKGAKVKSITAINADTYETTLEIILTPKFFNCLSHDKTVSESCITNPQGANQRYNSQSKMNTASITPYSCSSIDCYKHPDISGFYSQEN